MNGVNETKNLYFINISDNYLNDYLNMFNDYDYYHNFEINHVDKTIDDVKKWIKNNSNCHQYTIVNKLNNDFVGVCGFNEANGYPEEISIYIAKKYRGMKFGNEIMDILIDIGFNELMLERIEGCILLHNDKSIYLCKKYGFVEYERTDNDVCMELKK